VAQLDFLASHAESMPDKPAVILGDRSVSFAEMNRRANQVARAFAGLGCAAEDRVALMSSNSIEGSELAAAMRRLGVIAVPVNYRLRGAEVAYVVNDSGAKVVVAGAEHVRIVDEARPEVSAQVRFIAIGDLVPSGWIGYQELTSHLPDGPLPGAEAAGLGPTMIYTSGTTGHPKGAWRPHGVDVPHVLQLISTFELTQSDVHLMCGPGYHSAVSLFGALHGLLGATVVLQPRFDAAGAIDLIQRHRVTTTFMAPTLLQRLLDEQEARPKDLSSLRSVLLGAAPCPYPLKVRAERLLGQVLWEFYGATETGISTVLRPEDQLRKPGSCGTALPGHEIKLVLPDGSDAANGVPGELMVRNPWLAEYYLRPDATSAGFHDGFFSVGDIAYRDDDGFFFICDRQIDMIISAGMNIYPAEIEAVLHAHPAVMDAAVIGVPDDHWGESVKAVVQLRPGMSVSEPELIEFCAERLAGYKKPRSIDFAGELPRDAAGKLLKRKIREPFWAGAGRQI
jgi:fatty-acyl-CoA synthase/long-chain acyl-CoA synthetase